MGLISLDVQTSLNKSPGIQEAPDAQVYKDPMMRKYL